MAQISQTWQEKWFFTTQKSMFYETYLYAYV